MSFLCQQHRSQLCEDVNRAESSWHRTMARARFSVQHQAWDKAVMHYGNSLDISDILVSHHGVPDGVDRYVRTAVEMMHAVRNSRYWQDTQAFYEMIMNRMKAFEQLSIDDRRLTPFRDVTFKPLDQVNTWMPLWHHWFERAQETVH